MDSDEVTFTDPALAKPGRVCARFFAKLRERPRSTLVFKWLPYEENPVRARYGLSFDQPWNVTSTENVYW